ncbi:WD40-repeat-containing domain protein [Spinellus fusiger]|nr:WD40-repeat-containing domain protein [Spinellus fusiger]
MVSMHRALFKRALHDPRTLLTDEHISSRCLLPWLRTNDQQTYNFHYPDGRKCIPYACDFAYSTHGGQLLAVTDEYGRVTLIRTDKSSAAEDMDYHKTFQAHDGAVYDIKWCPNDQYIATAAADKLMLLWDVETQTRLACFQDHEMTLKSVNWHPVNPHLLVTASKDGSINVWDTRFRIKDTLSAEDGLSLPIYAPIRHITDAHCEPSRKTRKTPPKAHLPDRPVTCALFINHGEDKIVSSGSHDGTIKMWDCRLMSRANHVVSCTSGVARGISDMKIDASGSRLFSLCMDQSVYMHYIINLPGSARRYTDPHFSATSFYLRLSLSHDDQFLLAGSSSSSVCAWEVERPERGAYRFADHGYEVTSVAWSKTTTRQVQEEA